MPVGSTACACSVPRPGTKPAPGCPAPARRCDHRPPAPPRRRPSPHPRRRHHTRPGDYHLSTRSVFPAADTAEAGLHHAGPGSPPPVGGHVAGRQRSRRACSTRSAVWWAPGAGRHMPWPPLVHLDVPAGVEHPGHVRGADVVGRSKPAARACSVSTSAWWTTSRVPPGATAASSARSASSPGVAAQRGVLRGHQVERGRRKARVEQAAVLEQHVGARLPGVQRRALQRHARHVERGHLPAPGSEPDRVRAPAAAHVERSPRLESGHFGDQSVVGRPLQTCRTPAYRPSHSPAAEWAGPGGDCVTWTAAPTAATASRVVATSANSRRRSRSRWRSRGLAPPGRAGCGPEDLRRPRVLRGVTTSD